MTNKEKIEEIVIDAYNGWTKVGFTDEEMIAILSKLAEWKDQQLRERLEYEIEKANTYYDKKLNQHELYKHIGAVIALSELLGIKFPTDRLHMRFATMD